MARLTLWQRRERDRAIRRIAALFLVPFDALVAAPFLLIALFPLWILVSVTLWFLNVEGAFGLGALALVPILMVAGALVVARARNLGAVILGRLQAMPLPAGEYRALYSALDDMKIAAGLQVMPTLWLIESPSVNAMAVGLRVADTRIAVTQGMLDHLAPSEVTAVFAHLVARVVSGDVFANTLEVSTVATILPSDAAPRGGLPGKRKRAALALERADVDAQFLLRNPGVLLSALKAICMSQNHVAGAADVFGALFISWPGFAGDLAFVPDHDTRRVERMRKLSHEPVTE